MVGTSRSLHSGAPGAAAPPRFSGCVMHAAAETDQMSREVRVDRRFSLIWRYMRCIFGIYTDIYIYMCVLHILQYYGHMLCNIYIYVCLHLYVYVFTCIYIYILLYIYMYWTFSCMNACVQFPYTVYIYIHIYIYNIYTRTIDVDNEVVQWPMERHATIQPQVYACDRIPMFHDQPPPAC